MDYIKDEDDLLHRYIVADLLCISEYSSDITEDKKELERIAKEYALRKGLDFPEELF